MCPVPFKGGANLCPSLSTPSFQLFAPTKLIPYDFECKNQEKMKTIYQWYNQAKRHGDLEPVLVMKQNSREELVVVSLDHFLKLIA